ncbi:MAG TPA: right-handed parallel beta-helix repeat-containing protein [Chitinophagaceae bacterium]|nr:right-handed parallel beta-helix repeat-containing protein [Chitinophagaceae bacterium]
MKRIFFFLVLLSSASFAQTEKFIADALVKPKTQERLITVGGTSANIPGYTNQAIQIAVDALPVEGGTVKMDPGEYKMMAPVRLRSNVKLIGSGTETILKRIDGYHSKFVIDADYGELKITVEDPSGFKPGMSIQITNKPNSECWDVTTAVITDIVKDTLYFDTYLIRDYDSELNGMVTNAGSCVSVHDAQNVYISDFMVDGNKEKNDLLDGCNGGGIVIIKSKDVTVEKVHVKDFNGEGITWQITENVTVKNCEISGCTNMGLHPGTGSPNSLIENNNSHNNKVGLFICWRVHHSVVRGNQFHNNSENGISTGHKDSDVLFDNNHVYENMQDGVHVREEDDKNSPHRNTFINNVVENNGGYGFFISGKPSNMLIKENVIRSTIKGKQKAAIFIANDSLLVKEENNKMSGYENGNIVYEKK